MDAANQDELRAALATHFPNLHFVEAGTTIRGTIAIEHHGKELDRFAVEVQLQRPSELELPIVKEIGGRIPWLADRHVNEDGSACVCLPNDYFARFPGRFDLLAFLKGPVRDFFVGQALVERGDPWPHGEWAHGDTGASEWFHEFVQAQSQETATAYLTVLALNELKGHVVCPCGSGRHVRDCHRVLLQRLRDVMSPDSARKILAKTRRRALSQKGAPRTRVRRAHAPQRE